MSEENNYLPIEDHASFTEFSLVATLMYYDLKPVALDRDPNMQGRVAFVFRKEDKLEKIKAGYWEGNLLVEPKKFWGIIRELKSRIRGEK